MRYLMLVLLLASCATPLTPEQRAQLLVQRVDNLIAKYGQACEAIGLVKASQSWGTCVVGLAQEEDAQSAASRAHWARALQNISDDYRRRSTATTCQWVGTLWTCRGQ